MSASEHPVGRRDFLKTAAASAASVVSDSTLPHAASQQDHDHDHDHQDVPSDVALRVKALESLLVDKGYVDRAILDRRALPSRRRSSNRV